MKSRIENALSDIPSPSFVIDESLIERNMKIVQSVQSNSGAKVLLALKAFAMYDVFPQITPYVAGITASSLNEALLAFTETGQKVHCCFPIYLESQFDQIQAIASHITFNSLTQYERFKSKLKPEVIKYALRVNPGYSEVEVDLYNPCAPTSRLGIPVEELGSTLPAGISGLHFHALCENDSRVLERTLASFSSKYESFLHDVEWVNFGGGHLMTSEGYDVSHLVSLLDAFSKTYKVDVILEPGSTHVWQTGYLVASIQDLLERGGRSIAMLDVSFTAHMPDCLEMPYKPSVLGEHEWGDYTYTFGGNSCLAGDQLSGFVFKTPLAVGQKIVFKDMAHYTMVKTNMFNGVDHPTKCIIRKSGKIDILKKFSFDDFKSRM